MARGGKLTNHLKSVGKLTTRVAASIKTKRSELQAVAIKSNKKADTIYNARGDEAM
jgi:hypothetical protein